MSNDSRLIDLRLEPPLSHRNQNTIARPVAVSGFGYWSGLDATVEFRPAPANSGVTFVRSDLPGNPRLPADIQYRVDASRRTTLYRDGASVEMVEHVLAALAGLQIDNCQVWINNAEIPGFDGSSWRFVEALDEVGKQSQNATRSRLHVAETIRVEDDDQCWIQVEPAHTFQLTYNLEYPSGSPIGKQTIHLSVTPDHFRRELAAARTFLLKHEAEMLLNQGLGQRVSFRDLLVFGEEGPIANPLRFADECARHKALDVLGDLALSGYDICGHVTASRSGHRLNGELVKQLCAKGCIQPPPEMAKPLEPNPWIGQSA